ncbi:hypothetical protein HH213_26155 [Duganella dendranthematis]|uniref:Uncharacterized protein n=1 Tax=Duganella dendranthematis TaxID=2728021 RepID=A0ABX6MG57_9BURK|nr:hypothetical protein [Duganella dendranthematis]QJD93260.1 hypothetical protein HH213_26155 [Duganella dendranthematis]
MPAIIPTRSPAENYGLVHCILFNETTCSGGRVPIIDTDTGKYYGTGNYPHWEQHCINRGEQLCGAEVMNADLRP